MFYLTSPDGRNAIVYVQQFTKEMVVLKRKGERVIHKELGTFGSDEEAYAALCMRVQALRREGYGAVDTALASYAFPASTVGEGRLTVESHSVSFVVKKCTPVQFNAGIAQMDETFDVLKTPGVSFKQGDGWFELEPTHPAYGESFKCRLLSEQAFRDYPSKLKELCLARGYVDNETLLPGGRGRMLVVTGEGVVDIYIRAFLHGLIKAGAEVSFKGDRDWSFFPMTPFAKRDVSELAWYQEPGLHELLMNGGLVKCPHAPLHQTPVSKRPLFL
ncbi:hypothetical protein QAO71_17680 (plasmid) [Halopseudomonas sp. SMJS2]|uniref:hypothetical protein n=1 Tax=Halopseudomonas sp. SMJS2 TaxID=3041098 RepID=UPI0024536CB7|nr:hypothetical protein [Halopseudomonas sp. SMJS2]WGK63372.1 hypothetical protein QAO71_17680 [Halopseudomonas sp. SMJS2]